MSDTRREMLAAALDGEETDVETEAPDTTPEPVEAGAPAEAEETSPRPMDAPSSKSVERDTATGKFVKPGPSKLAAVSKPSTKPGATPGQASATATPSAKAAGAQPGEPPAQADAPKLKAPASWGPAAKEKWATLPPEVQAEASRVDKEVRKVLGEAASSRQRDAAWSQALTPHMGLIQANGGNPMAVVSNYLQTGAVLHNGAPGQKAALVADIIRNFGVPVELLAQALDGQPMQQQAQPQRQAPQEFRDPRVDQMLAARQQEVASSAQREIEELESAAEFMDDEGLRHTMADLLDTAARRGHALTPKQAYDAAIASGLVPHVQGILQQRERAKQATAAQASTMRARAAASSVKSRPTSSMSAQGRPLSRRDVLAQQLYGEE